MKIKKLLFFLFCTVMLLSISCNRNGEFENRIMVEQLANLKLNMPFSLDTMNQSNWDTLYIATPYGMKQFEELNIQMTNSTKNRINSAIIGSEGVTTLLFTKKHKLINYSFISRVTAADFSNIDNENQGIPANTLFILDSVRFHPRVVHKYH